MRSGLVKSSLGNVLALAVVVFASAGAGLAQPADSPPASTADIEVFLAQLQRASKADDRDVIASMIRYPITISIAGLRVPFTDAAGILARYDDIFNSALRDSISRASVRPQTDRKEVTVIPDAYLVGGSELVITQVNGQLRITSISVPQSAGEADTTAPSVGSSAGAARTHEPRRIAIRVGPRATQVAGLLARDAIDSFILYLPKGQLAGVRLERVPAGAAVIRVVHARTGAILGARASADGRFVSGRPAEGADYRIEVRRIDNADEAPLPYMLSLTLR
jgi:hypothetical protein